jgi:hypothetical protein
MVGTGDRTEHAPVIRATLNVGISYNSDPWRPQNEAKAPIASELIVYEIHGPAFVGFYWQNQWDPGTHQLLPPPRADLNPYLVINPISPFWIDPIPISFEYSEKWSPIFGQVA